MPVLCLSLAAIQQQICAPAALDKLRDRLLKRALAESTVTPDSRLLQFELDKLEQLNKQMRLASRNLAFAENESRYRQLSTVIAELEEDKRSCEQEITRARVKLRPEQTPDETIDGLLRGLDQIRELAAEENNMAGLAELFETLNLRMFLRFTPVQVKKRVENKLTGGILTMGAAPWPIEPYCGPTGRSSLKRKERHETEQSNDSESAHVESTESLGNESRGDCASFERLVAAYVDAAFSVGAESIAVSWIAKRSA